jgi:tRNA (mo5U34)-methyltransferase
MTPVGADGYPDWRDIERRAEDRVTAHGDYPRWQAALDALPDLFAERIVFGDTVTVEGPAQADDRRRLKDALLKLHPWRKGPFELFGVHIDSEWRSDWKWQRVRPFLGYLEGQTVLDVGCGNGYFGWRALEAGAAEVVGIDPSVLFVMQHRAIRRYVERLESRPNRMLPLPFEALPPRPFDLVMSMGVIYHRRDAQAHVARLHACTRPGGRVVLESLIVEGPSSLHPASQPGADRRYARMRNVHIVPTIEALERWLRGAGYEDVELIDVSPTTQSEQRRTDWMRFESLAEALDSTDPTRTVEGYPAPVRASLVARRPVTGGRTHSRV